MGNIESFEDLQCWKACRKVIDITRKTIANLPKEEKYDLVSNMKRASRSSTRNIAEGFGRYHYKENIQFCRISRGSLTELIDDFITCYEDNYISEVELQGVSFKVCHRLITILKKDVRTKRQRTKTAFQF